MVDMNINNWTYGCELEFADHDIRTELPKGYGRDTHDITMVNSNGIANDPSGKLYSYGGEINTPPTSTIQGQIDCLEELKELLPTATINYRSNLHLHIRVPGLKDDLAALKRFQAHIHKWMPLALPIIEPIPEPVMRLSSGHVEADRNLVEYKGARRRYNRRKVSHQTLLTPKRLAYQLEASTVEEFFAREVPWSPKLGKPQWQCQPRLCVNLRQLRETDTIEFRHFPGTMCPRELSYAFTWVHNYTVRALQDYGLEDVIYGNCEGWGIGNMPKFLPYCHWQEERYRMTCHDGSLSKAKIKENIQKILEDDSHEYFEETP